MASKACAEMQMKELGYLTARVDDIDTIEQLGDPFLKLQYDHAMLEETYRLPANTRESEARGVLQNEMQKIWLEVVDLDEGAMQDVKKIIDEVLAKPF